MQGISPADVLSPSLPTGELYTIDGTLECAAISAFTKSTLVGYLSSHAYLADGMKLVAWADEGDGASVWGSRGEVHDASAEYTHSWDKLGAARR